MTVTARVMPMEKARQKSMPVAIIVLIVLIPGCQCGRKPKSYKKGLAAVCTRTPAEAPTTLQNGMRSPAKIGPRCTVMPRGAAGIRLPRNGLRSQNGMGMRVIGSPR